MDIGEAFILTAVTFHFLLSIGADLGGICLVMWAFSRLFSEPGHFSGSGTASPDRLVGLFIS